MSESAHAGKTVHCRHPEDDVEEERTLTFEEHGQFHSSGFPRDRFEAAGLKFTCPDCGHVFWLCPICSDEADRSPAGWIDSENERGDFEQVPCHNCNGEEVARQRRGY